jgi:hypothetical protein
LGRLRRFEAFCGLPDQRDARGLRYTVVTVLVFVVLAKLAGENHPRGIAQWVKLRIERLFAPESCTPGFSPAAHEDFRRDETVEKGHGRIERRTLTVSSAWQGYLNWPAVEQVFKLERDFTRVKSLP